MTAPKLINYNKDSLVSLKEFRKNSIKHIDFLAENNENFDRQDALEDLKGYMATLVAVCLSKVN